MQMQQPIEVLVRLGPFPSYASATPSQVQAIEAQLAKVTAPITDEEACALAKLFGPDDCFGMEWTLLHLIETAPGWPIEEALHDIDGEWIDRLRERAGLDRASRAT